MRRPPLLFLCALALALCSARPGLARGMAAGQPTLSGPVHVRPGDWIEIGWGDLPVGVYEAEIEMSVDLGPWQRVSPELDARQRRFAFRAPLAPGALARVRLRFGGDGYERQSEAEILIRIAGDPVAREDDAPLALRETGAIALDPVHETVAPALAFPVHAPVSRSATLPPASQTPAVAGDARRAATSTVLTAPATRAPFRPLRN